jgi:predicted phage terminase large subunit-like protein
MLAMNQRRRPLIWWAEKGMISKSIGPFLRDLMQEQGNYINIEEVTPVKSKEVRAQSIRGRMALGMVRFPRFATWWPNAKHELLSFPGGKNDDLVDALAHLGMGIDRMTAPSKARKEPEVPSDQSFRPTLRWLKDSAAKKERIAQLGQLDR